MKMIKVRVAETIDEIKITIDRILKKDAETAEKEKEKSNKSDKSKKSNNVSIENSFYSSFAMFSAFAIDFISYKLLRCWIVLLSKRIT
jgi:hypothetical protein